MRKFMALGCMLWSLAIYGQQQNTLRQHSQVLKRFLEKNHYQPLQWNDSSSAMLYDKWISNLDDEKLFFTQANIAALEAYKYKLDDELMGKEWNFFAVSTAQFQFRLEKTDSMIKAILAKPFDLSKPDNFNWPEKDFASNDAEVALRWQRFLKWRVLDIITTNLAEKGKDLAVPAPADLVQQEASARDKVRKQELYYIKNLLSTPQRFSEDMEDEYLNSIAWCYDPHTSYMNLKEKNEFEAEVSASEYSAGLNIKENEKGDKVVSYLQPGGSAWRSGQVHSGDEVVKVKMNGVEKEAADMEEDELEGLLAGSNSEAVEITVKTTSGEVKTVDLIKEKATDEDEVVKSYLLRAGKNIGYINLPGFYSKDEDVKDIKYNGCANDVSKEIVKLKKDSIAGLIIDLRYNGGGSMWEAMQLAGIFIDIGPVASTKDRDGKVHFLKDPNRGTIYDGPLMVLINGGSASASEFLSAALQDYNRALIVGSNTYGKGTAQIVLPMDTGTISDTKTYTDFVKVTEEKFYRINGATTQWKGVVPDINLPDLFDDEYKEKANASALQPDNSRPGIYEALRPLPVAQLKLKSQQRVQADSFFIGISQLAKRLNGFKTGMAIPLQLSAYIAFYKNNIEQFKSLKSEKKLQSPFAVSNNNFDRLKFSSATEQSREVNETYIDHIRTDRGIREAVNIMMDWQQLL